VIWRLFNGSLLEPGRGGPRHTAGIRLRRALFWGYLETVSSRSKREPIEALRCEPRRNRFFSRQEERRHGNCITSSVRAMAGKAPRHRWHSWHSRQRGVCNLQILKQPRELRIPLSPPKLGLCFQSFTRRSNNPRAMSPKLVLVSADNPAGTDDKMLDFLP
jgi:hypothetical protein